MQKITIAGNVGKDAVLNTSGNDPVLNFSVAVSNGKDKDPTWFDCAMFGKRAESLAPYIKKGTKLTLDGRISMRVHEGKGYLKVSVNDLTLMGGGAERSDSAEPRSGGGGGGSVSGGGGGGGASAMSDDIPFAPEWR